MLKPLSCTTTIALDSYSTTSTSKTLVTSPGVPRHICNPWRGKRSKHPGHISVPGVGVQNPPETPAKETGPSPEAPRSSPVDIARPGSLPDRPEHHHQQQPSFDRVLHAHLIRIPRRLRHRTQHVRMILPDLHGRGRGNVLVPHDPR